jgi:transcriptional regulator with XRE-family HTH domain
METIAARIKRLRLERQMTQAQLGAAIDRDQSIVSDMEKGRGFRIDCLPALCRALGVSADYLIFGPEHAAQLSELMTLAGRLTDPQRVSLTAMLRSMTQN